MVAARADLSRHDGFAYRAAGFFVVAAIRAKLAAPQVWAHFREEQGQVFVFDIPSAELAHAGGIDHRAAEIEREHFLIGGGVPPFAVVVAHGADALAQPGLDGVEQ